MLAFIHIKKNAPALKRSYQVQREGVPSLFSLPTRRNLACFWSHFPRLLANFRDSISANNIYKFLLIPTAQQQQQRANGIGKQRQKEARTSTNTVRCGRMLSNQQCACSAALHRVESTKQSNKQSKHSKPRDHYLLLLSISISIDTKATPRTYIPLPFLVILRLIIPPAYSNSSLFCFFSFSFHSLSPHPHRHIHTHTHTHTAPAPTHN